MASKSILAVLAVAALALPVQASAKSAHSGSGNGGGKNMVADATVTSVDSAGGVVTVTIERGNKAADAFKGPSVDFNVSGSHLQAGDANNDGNVDLQDVTAGDVKPDADNTAKKRGKALQGPHHARRRDGRHLGRLGEPCDAEHARPAVVTPPGRSRTSVRKALR